MSIRFFNTLSRSAEDFVPQQEGVVSFYSCGPTVYNYAHIGNMRANCFYDLVKRYLTYRGYRVEHVMNITDVDDKTIRDSQKEGKTLKEFTDYYTDAFLEDLKILNVEIPESLPRATDEIEGMVELIEALLEKGHAYKSDQGDIYFKIESFPNYGKLAHIDLDKLRDNARGRLNRADEYDKENVQDFALWKGYDEEDGDVFWETRIGKGRPGWHTECSAMSARYLDLPIDIHAGGIDLCFPHHTNEIAQSECAYEKTFVKYWLHNEFVIVDGKKMSKSDGNFYTLRDLLKIGLHPSAIRYELLKTHYRLQLDFRIANMEQNCQVLARFEDFLQRLALIKEGAGLAGLEEIVQSSEEAFQTAMDNDLNVAEGMAAIFEFMKRINRDFDQLSRDDAQKVQQLMERFDSVFGFIIPPAAELSDPDIERLIEERTQARENKDFARADEIRDELLARGIELKDAPDGVRWTRRR